MGVRNELVPSDSSSKPGPEPKTDLLQLASEHPSKRRFGCSHGVWCLLVFFCLALGWGVAAERADQHLQRAAELLATGALEAAEKEARLALNAPAARPAAYSVLGGIRIQQNRIKEGRRFLEKALELNPHLLGARLNLGHVYVLESKPERAREMYRLALQTDPDNFNARMSLAQLEADTGNFAASVETAKPVAALLRNSPEGLHLLATGYLGLGQREMARALLTDWRRQPSVPVELAVSFAQLLLSHDLKQEAAEVLAKARTDAPPSFEVAAGFGDAYLRLGDLKEAAANYARAIDLNSSCTACYVQLGRIAEREGDTEKALAYLIRAKRLEPDNPEVLFVFGRVCLRRNLFRDAIPALEKAFQSKPDDDRYAFVLASAYGMKLRFKESLELFGRLVKKKPEDPVLNYSLGSVLCTEGRDYAEAEKYLRKSISLQPEQLSAYYYLAVAVLKTGREDEAAAIFRELLQRYPDHIPSLEQLGMILVKNRKYDEARQILDKVLRLDPTSLRGHYQMSMLLGRLGQKEEAEKHRQMAQRLEDEEKRKRKTELYLLTPH